MRWDAHWEHKAHDIPMEEKPEYAYQNIRTKNFFWGDGDKVSHLPIIELASRKYLETSQPLLPHVNATWYRTIRP